MGQVNLNIQTEVSGERVWAKIQIGQSPEDMKTWEFESLSGKNREPWQVISDMMKTDTLRKIGEQAENLAALVDSDAKMKEKYPEEAKS